MGFPGEKSAVRAEALEDYWRDFAFLGINEELRFPGGLALEVRQLTLRMYVQLCAVRSPFFKGGRVGPEHVAQVLWRLSPKYDTRTTNPNARQELVAEIARLPFRASVRVIDRFLQKMMLDKPPIRRRKNGAKVDTSFAASIIHAIASSYGWSDELILDLPMPRIFQYMRKIHRDNDPDLARFSPLRDRFRQRVMDNFLQKRREWNEQHADES